MELDADQSVCNDALPPEKRVNQFGVLENKHMTVKDWQRRWELNLDKMWHMPRVHPMLQKHYEQLTQGKSDQRILVPLCGRTLDLSW
jgi:phenylpropionate dioxygenase-like ring-hydroxylating dioxygenase large terminal subunit